MPIYEYACPSCRHEFEQIVKVSAPPPPCPSCGSADVAKKISLAAFHLKGGGWYSDAYSGADNKKPADSSPAKVSTDSTASPGSTAAASSTEGTAKTPAKPSTDSAAASKPAAKPSSSTASSD